MKVKSAHPVRFFCASLARSKKDKKIGTHLYADFFTNHFFFFRPKLYPKRTAGSMVAVSPAKEA